MEQRLEVLTEHLQRLLFVEVEASGRHVHVTREQAQRLFGHDLTPVRDLSQPGQFVARERVNIKGPKGEFRNVAVLGPCRNKAQVEISLTDARTLGIEAPVRLSGDVAGSPGCELTGEHGSLVLDMGVVAAKRHIHMSPEDAARQHVADGEVVRLKLMTKRPVVFEDVSVRVDPMFQTAAHLDYDEANACGWHKGDLGMILK